MQRCIANISQVYIQIELLHIRVKFVYAVGHFDIPDRLFQSVGDTHALNMTSLSEVKELIPEFYSNSAFLKNLNGFDMGTTQKGDKVHRLLVRIKIISPPHTR